jgi:hypothetical protein
MNSRSQNGTSRELPSSSEVEQQVQGYADRARNTAQNFGDQAAEHGRNLLDRISTPDQRKAVVDKAQCFINAHPKLSALVGLNLVLTGVPLLFFILFSVGTFVLSIVVALVVALIAAVTFTLFSVGVALFFLLPIVFVTTASACFLFFWGLVGYFILRWATAEKGVDNGQGRQTTGEKLNRLTDGKSDDLKGQAHNVKEEVEEQGDKLKESAKTNGSHVKGKAEDAAKNTFGSDNVNDAKNGRVPRSVAETTEKVKENVAGR